ncbi:MAG: hypothetical protein O2V44_00240 [Candidatus Bathyarchaeota archaeon]|nr:hypothetical protein [Candidatus Bathyarchaeota archaeon]MCZ2807761.1 hypothetical protein [Candidatus Bathyarchaeota archaeon]
MEPKECPETGETIMFPENCGDCEYLKPGCKFKKWIKRCTSTKKEEVSGGVCE